jgi:hypothetical protein
LRNRELLEPSASEIAWVDFIRPKLSYGSPGAPSARLKFPDGSLQVDRSVISMPGFLQVGCCDRSLAALALIVLLPLVCRSQLTTVTIPSGDSLRVGVTKRARLQPGAPVEGVLLSSIYVETQLVLPAGSIVRGIVSGTPPASKSIRIWAKLDADFTPLREAIVDFNRIN